MIQDDIDEIELAIKHGDESGHLVCMEHYLEAIAKTQLLIIREIGTD